jgi:hypothetical protein
VRRLLATIAIVLCTIQSTQILALVLPDGCAEEASKNGFGGQDECQTGCARCLCCGRRSLPEPASSLAAPDSQRERPHPPADLSRPNTPAIHDVFHVPKHATSAR